MIAYESHPGLWAEIERRDVDAATAAESHPRSGVACEMGLASAGLGEMDHQAQCQQYEQDVHTSEEKYLDSLEECKRLEVKLSETKRFVFNYF